MTPATSSTNPSPAALRAPLVMPTRLESILLVGRTVLLETIRRKEFYVLGIFSLLFIIGVLITRFVGIANASTASFLLNLGITFALAGAQILTLLTGARQVPNEIETRTLYPLLAKPVRRSDYLLGKWLATWGSGLVTLGVLFLLSWLPIPEMAPHSGALLVQMLLLQALGLALLAALSVFASLLMPQALSITMIAVWLISGDKFVSFVRAMASGKPAESTVRWVTAYLPNFADLNLATRYTDGIAALGAGQFLGLALYAAVLTTLILVASISVFDRRPL